MLIGLLLLHYGFVICMLFMPYDTMGNQFYSCFKLDASVTHYLLVSVMSCCTDYGFLLSGKPSFTKKQADLFFPPDFPDDFPVSMQV
jgi:hypothetical protein